MSQFDLYENLNKDSRKIYPYFVDIQSNLLESLNSRVVIPLTPSRYLDDRSISTLCPTTTILGDTYVLLTHQMTSVPISALQESVVSLDELHDEIIAAVDLLITGI